MSLHQSQEDHTTWFLPDSLLGTQVYLSLADWQSYLDVGKPAHLFHGRLIIPQLVFASGSSRLSPEAQTALSSLLVPMGKAEGAVWQVNGYTDNTGEAAENQRLARSRVISVKNHWLSLGIPPNQIEIQGLGEIEPVADNESPEGRAQNRRVEILLKQLPRSSVRYYPSERNMVEKVLQEEWVSPSVDPNPATEIEQAKEKKKKAKATQPAKPSTSQTGTLQLVASLGVSGAMAAGPHWTDLKDQQKLDQELLGEGYDLKLANVPVAAPVVGVSLVYSLPEHLSFQVGLRYQQIGFRLENVFNLREPEFSYDEQQITIAQVRTHLLTFPLALHYQLSDRLSIGAEVLVGGSLNNWARARTVTQTDVVINGELDPDWSREREVFTAASPNLNRLLRIGGGIQVLYTLPNDWGLGARLTYFPNAFDMDGPALHSISPQVFLQFPLPSMTIPSSTPSTNSQ
ncbi:MAG: OmpA family protein [Bacteroidota bacterium]